MKFNKKILFSILLVVFITIIIAINSILPIKKPNDCFSLKFEKTDYEILNEEYDFKKVFNCSDWDEIMIIGGPTYSRIFTFVSSGIIIPEYDYIEYPEHTYFLFFIKNSKVISKVIPFGAPNFILSQNFNNSNFLKVSRNNSKFIYKEFENDYFEMYTLKLLDE